MSDNKNIIGGYGANYVVGGADFKIRDNNMDWSLMPKDYPLDKKISVVNDILALQEYIDDPKILCRVICVFFELPPRDLIKVLAKTLNLAKPIEIMLRKLYYVWLDLINMVLATYIEHAFSYAEVEKALTKTAESPIMLVQELDKKLLGAYKHVGYCPYEPIVRVKNILTFPLSDVIKKVRRYDSTFLAHVNINTVYGDILGIVKQLNINLDVKKNHNSKCGKSLESCVDSFLGLYDKYHDTLISLESTYIAVAKQIEKIIYIIQRILVV
jgi:hypothetical protein